MTRENGPHRGPFSFGSSLDRKTPDGVAPSGSPLLDVGVRKERRLRSDCAPPAAAAGGGCPAGKVRVLLPIRPPAIHGRLWASPSCIHGRHEPSSWSGGKSTAAP